MLFGLHGAAATFQRLVDQVLRGLESFAAANIVNIVIFSATWKEHLGHLAEVFDRIQWAGLVVNAKKVPDCYARSHLPRLCVGRIIHQTTGR